MTKVKNILGKKQFHKSVSETLSEILHHEFNPYDISPVRPTDLTEWQHHEALRLLAEQIDSLWSVIQQHTEGKL